MTSSGNCRKACIATTRNASTGINAIETLIESGCGRPDPEELFWTCLLAKVDAEKSAVFTTARTKVNPETMRLHCCAKAVTPTCRHACIKVSNTAMPLSPIEPSLTHSTQPNRSFWMAKRKHFTAQKVSRSRQNRGKTSRLAFGSAFIWLEKNSIGWNSCARIGHKDGVVSWTNTGTETNLYQTVSFL